ncbi:MAG: hypothetical protein A2Y81_05685 [Nitrospirae bacterium RBG_13_43_8]|nr:MAG: hypothetical protein A2Y81_05685 [Nitrospirae bacterium RBG_13_43_8]
MAGIAELVSSAKGLGIFDFFIPFIMMFAIFYGLLYKTKIFGDPSKERASRTISLVIALAASSYIMVFTPAGVTISGFLAAYFSKTLVVVLALLGVLIVFYLLMNILKPEAKWDLSKFGWGALLIAIVLGISIFVSSGGAGIFPGIKNINIGGLDSGTMAIIVVIILTGLVIYYLISGDGGGSGNIPQVR